MARFGRSNPGNSRSEFPRSTRIGTLKTKENCSACGGSIPQEARSDGNFMGIPRISSPRARKESRSDSLATSPGVFKRQCIYAKWWVTIPVFIITVPSLTHSPNLFYLHGAKTIRCTNAQRVGCDPSLIILLAHSPFLRTHQITFLVTASAGSLWYPP